MNFVAGVPSRWLVTLHSGSVIELAADCYSEADGDLLFSILVDATPEEQSQMVVEGRTPYDPARVIVLVAKIPVAEVADILTAPSWFDDGSQSDSTPE
ncbi:hypothetical protein [Acrocarpospora catenulata]|uniref:hypothetical protein n=1 Tax=Acrocarpospora catenulata TaxID=2836182 RepID=UPI001BDB54A3|nr:hypothetical protein [Acrocarpospora catenulata]